MSAPATSAPPPPAGTPGPAVNPWRKLRVINDGCYIRV